MLWQDELLLKLHPALFEAIIQVPAPPPPRPSSYRLVLPVLTAHRQMLQQVYPHCVSTILQQVYPHCVSTILQQVVHSCRAGQLSVRLRTDFSQLKRACAVGGTVILLHPSPCSRRLNSDTEGVPAE